MKRIAAPDRNAASCLFLAAVWCFCHTGLLGLIGRQGLAYAGPAMEMTAIGFAALTLPASLVMDRMIRARYVRKNMPASAVLSEGECFFPCSPVQCLHFWSFS